MMKQTANVAIEGGGSFRARTGQTLLDAALVNGVDMPHDCRSGHCGTCRCTVTAGSVEGGEAGGKNEVLACQARVVDDVAIAFEETPPIELHAGRVRSIQAVSGDVVKVMIETKKPLDFLPGQYCQFRFAGFPGRCYSPTAPIGGPADRNVVRLHIRRVPNGRISQALGETIKPGHKVKIEGPYGSAFLRPGRSQRLVLVASGTGFAPIWSIAIAAVSEMPDREIVAVVGARTRESFYMAPALKRLIAFPNASIVPVVQYGQESGVVRVGSPADCLPRLSEDDIVYAAGAPGMVNAVSEIARTAGASCYADPFAPSEAGQEPFNPLALAGAAARRVGGILIPSLRGA